MATTTPTPATVRCLISIFFVTRCVCVTLKTATTREWMCVRLCLQSENEIDKMKKMKKENVGRQKQKSRNTHTHMRALKCFSQIPN